MELKVLNVERSFNGKRVLKGVSLSLEDGDVYLLLGPNASGKSTLLKIISTILKPDSGDVLVDDVSVVKNPSIMRRIASYVPEVPSLVDEMSVLENLKFFSRLFKLDVDLDRILSEYRLTSEMRKPVSKISKGMRQRLSLAMAMMRDPKVLILDEPTSGLDRETIEFILEKIRRASNEGKIVLVSSHDENDLIRVATRIGILEDGKLILQKGVSEMENERLVEIDVDGERKLVKIGEILKDVKIERILGIRESLKV